MKLVAAKCTQCGACLDVNKSQEAAVCGFCGSAFIVQKAISNYNTSTAVPGKEDFEIRAGTLERYNGASAEVVVPEGVKAIGDECFMDSQITSIAFPPCLRRIGNGAFRRCANLTDVTLPDELLSIGDYAFADCPHLNDIAVPQSVMSIGVGAFACIKTTSREVFANLERHRHEEARKNSLPRQLKMWLIIVIIFLLFPTIVQFLIRLLGGYI